MTPTRPRATPPPPAALGRRLSAAGVVPLLACALVCLAGAARAQDQGRDAVHETIGTLVTLSAGPGLSGEFYRIDGVDLDLQKLELVLPLPGGLGRPLDLSAGAPARPPWVVDPAPVPFLLQPIVAVRAGYLTVEEPFRGELGARLPGGRLLLESASAGLGLGVRVQPWTWIRLEPRVDVVASRTTALPGGPPQVRAVLRTQADDLVHWRAETITTLVQLTASSGLDLGPARLSPRLTLGWVDVRTYSTSSPLQEGQGSSSLASVGLDVDVPLGGVQLAGAPLRARVGAAVTVYGGDAGRGFDGRPIVELPAALYLDTRRLLPLSRLGINGEYTRGEDIEGWAVSLEYDF